MSFVINGSRWRQDGGEKWMSEQEITGSGGVFMQFGEDSDRYRASDSAADLIEIRSNQALKRGSMRRFQDGGAHAGFNKLSCFRTLRHEATQPHEAILQLRPKLRACWVKNPSCR